MGGVQREVLIALLRLEREECPDGGRVPEGRGYRTWMISNEVRILRGLPSHGGGLFEWWQQEKREINKRASQEKRRHASEWYAEAARLSQLADATEDVAEKERLREEAQGYREGAAAANMLACLPAIGAGHRVLQRELPPNPRRAEDPSFAASAGIDRALKTLEARGLVERMGVRGFGLARLTDAGYALASEAET